MHERNNLAHVGPFLEPNAAAISFLGNLNSRISPFASGYYPQLIYATEVIDKDEPRAKTPEMRESIHAEVRDLVKCGTFKVILRSELPDEANTLAAN